ncbi:MAG: hypothetical protein JNL21_13425 [Myxococcales bacterium]|nr:hypothetical protein [Myxococcales bacterium]
MRLVRGDVVGGHYEVERHLDGSSLVDTYLARHLMAGKKVRLKILRNGEPWATALAGAAATWEKTEDDALVPCLAAGPAGKNSTFFAFGWEQGPTLAESVEGPMFPEAILELGGLVAGALSVIHENGLVHGHVRPSQIVLCQMRNGAPRLLDPVEPPETWIVGPASTYLAPEVVAGESPTPAADVYALGMTLATLANGTVWAPTEGRLGKLLAALVGLRPAIPSDDPALASWIVRMLAAAPAERPEARQVQEAFRRAQEGAGLPTLNAPSPALPEAVKALAMVVLRPPGARTPQAAGLDDTWRHAVESHGTKVHDLVDGSLVCRVDRGSLAAVVTTVSLVVRSSHEHAFRASAVCGLPVSREPGETTLKILTEVAALDQVASRTPAGVTRFTSRLADRLGGALPLKPSGDAFVLAQTGEAKRAPRRNGTLEMDAPPKPPSSAGRRRKTSEVQVGEPKRAGRGGTLVMEPNDEPAPAKRKKGGTLEIVVEPTPVVEAAPSDLDPSPTLEIIVDPELLEATRTGSMSKKAGRRATWSRRSG